MTKTNSSGQSLTTSIVAPVGFSALPLNIPSQSGYLDIELWLPGFSLGKHGLRIVQSTEFSKELKVAHDQIFESESGRKVCTVLHRMSISELRRWELPSLLFKSSSNGLCLIIGGDNTISSTLAKELSTRTFEQISWPQASVNGESMLLRALGEIAQRVQKSDAKSVVIVPNIEDISLLSEQNYFRYFAILADIVRANSSVNKVYLYLNDSEYTNSFRQFAREYGFEILTINSSNK